MPQVSVKALEGVLALLPDAALLVDQRGAIVYANPQADALFGYESGGLAGRPVDELVPERVRAAHAGHRAAYAAKPVQRSMGTSLNLRGRRRDGSDIAVDIMLSPMDTDGQLLALAVVRDMSTRQEEAARLKQENTALEQSNRAMMNREERILELKQEINKLCQTFKQPPRYL